MHAPTQNPFPNPSFEYDKPSGPPGGWITTNTYRMDLGGATAEVVHPSGVQTQGRTNYCHVTTSGATSAEGIDTGEVLPAKMGVKFTVYVWLFGPEGGGQQVELRLGSAASGGRAEEAVTLVEGWEQYSVTFTPTGNGLMGFAVCSQGTAKLAFDIAAVGISVSYFDGDTRGYHWTGTPGLSPSGEGLTQVETSGELLYQRALPLMEQDEEYGWFGRYLCEAIMGMLQGLDQIVLDQTINGVEYPGWCTLAVPAVCPDIWLPWCGSIYGVVLSPGIDAAAQRKTIEELPPQKRGGIEAMRKAAEASYPPGSEFTITLIERPGGKAYRIAAYTSPKQSAEEEAETLAALLTQKPGAIKLAYTSSERPRWEDATKAWDEVEAGVTWATAKTGEV